MTRSQRKRWRPGDRVAFADYYAVVECEWRGPDARWLSVVYLETKHFTIKADDAVPWVGPLDARHEDE